MTSWRLLAGFAITLGLALGPGVATAAEPDPSPEPSVVATPTVDPTAKPTAEPSLDPAPTGTPTTETVPEPTPTYDWSDPIPEPTGAPTSAKTTVASSSGTVARTTTLADSGAFTGTVKTSREFVDADGKITYEWPDGTRGHDTDEQRTVTLKVSTTKDLRARQQVDVTWSGAHPTGGSVADPNSPSARDQEYPFVLLQCRGVDTTGTVPSGQVRLSPQTCWTQTRPERYLEDSLNRMPPWRSDLWATAAERARFAGAPYTLPWPSSDPNGIEPPAACPKSKIVAAHWLPFKALSGKVYAGGPSNSGCANVPPETDDGQTGVRTNTVYGVTGTDGTGSTKFTLWTKNENASLGCSSDVKCALVAVPITGLSCDAWGVGVGDGTGLPDDARPDESSADTANDRCGADDNYKAGSGHGLQSANPASAGDLWWSASNWRNRITVPLTFAVSGDVCAVVNHDKPQTFFGSVAMSELTASWQPKFCTTKSLFSFTHVISSDPSARNLVNTGGIDVALGTAPPAEAYARPIARAPLAVSGFAIAFNIDDAERKPANELKLTPRLLAKLLTTSYAANTDISTNYAALANNPRNLLNDPEFQELNPSLRQLPDTAVFEAGSVMQTLATDSDLTWALTSYINADPTARAWLDGDADPWGMTVNPTYKGIDLPVTAWPLLDDWPLKDSSVVSILSSASPCFQVAPTPYLQLLANPLGLMSTIVQDLQDGVSAVKIECNAQDTADRDKIAFKQQGRQSVGYRFVLGIVPLSASTRYSLPLASLETTTGKFVAASDASLKAASSLLTAGTTSAGWQLDYAKLHTEAGAAAYPGTMPLYADIPTTGIDSKTAAHLADFLCYAAGTGQKQGSANGELPTGYLPLTDANGLAALHSQTYAAASAVRAQGGTVPDVGTSSVTKSDACTASDDDSSSSSDSTTTSTDSSTPTPSATTGPVDTPADAKVQALPAPPVVRTSAQQTWWGSYGPLLLLLLTFLAGIGGSALRWAPQVPGWLNAVRTMSVRIDE